MSDPGLVRLHKPHSRPSRLDYIHGIDLQQNRQNEITITQIRGYKPTTDIPNHRASVIPPLGGVIHNEAHKRTFHPNRGGGSNTSPVCRGREKEGKKEEEGQADSNSAPIQRSHTSRELCMLDISEQPPLKG